MKKRIISLVLILCSFFGLSSASASGWVAPYINMQITPHVQEMSNWCWAAAALMVGSYVYPDADKTQSDIVDYIKGSPTNNTYGSVWQTADAVDYVTDNEYNAMTNYPFTKIYDDLKQSIYNSRPVISLVQDGIGGSGHFYVLSGYNESTDSLFVINPGDGVRYTVNYYDFHYGDTEDGWRDSRPRVGDIYFTDWEG